ncbi:hypothetical protein GCM10009022_40030 [Vreelandella titanicae]|nr:hypothetical protein [Halomonas sp.]|tara:strand:+ start:641 stop:820 length:180 start_codon:yes stop_codon:yes gene_type:complete
MLSQVIFSAIFSSVSGWHAITATHFHDEKRVQMLLKYLAAQKAKTPEAKEFLKAQPNYY